MTNKLIGILAFAILILSCQKEEFISDSSAKLTFSLDTVIFDTVFTTIETVTKHFKVYNPHDKPIEIERIELATKENSIFRLNIDGFAGNSFRNKKVAAKDSFFIFVEATLNPNNVNNPLLIQDSVIFTTNGNTQDIDLVAWGQDINFFQNEIIETQTWNNDKPYLIYGNLLVDEGQTLNIEAGTKIHMHTRSSLLVLGTIKVHGTLDEPVVFQGDRLEEFYENIPDQWGTIFIFPSSKGNYFEHAQIINPTVGFQLSHPDSSANIMPELTLVNTLIKNCSFAGITSYSSKIRGYNLVIAETQHALYLVRGGDFEFIHCTFANPDNSNNFVGAKESIILSNHIIYNNNTLGNDIKQAYFGNCIVQSGNRNDLEIGEIDGFATNYLFDHSLIHIDNDSIDTENQDNFKDVIFNEKVSFIDLKDDLDEFETEYQLDTLSIAKDAGKLSITQKKPEYLLVDLYKNSRLLDNAPDLGAVERLE